MKKNKKIFVLTGDLGYGMFDQIKKDFPDRFINVGAAEQSLLDIGVGLVLKGKIPVCYSITPFLLCRAFETIRTYINREKIPVIMVGSGRGLDYEIDGFSHWANDDTDLMHLFENIDPYWPKTKEEIPALVGKILKAGKPVYLNLTR